MHKCVLVAENRDQVLELQKQVGLMLDLEIETVVELEQLESLASDYQSTEYVILPIKMMQQLTKQQQQLAQSNQRAGTQRETIVARSHHGIRKINVADVIYFMADQKYVTAYHTGGQLLLEESLTSLEQDLGKSFVRVHRKILVAVNQIIALSKAENGEHYVQLKDQTTKLTVSRRQLPKVRKVISNA